MTATSPYDELTPESIKASMLSDLTAKGVDVSIREGSYANTLVSVAAYQLFKMYQQFPSLLHMAFPDETSGEYIDKMRRRLAWFAPPARKPPWKSPSQGLRVHILPPGRRSMRLRAVCSS